MTKLIDLLLVYLARNDFKAGNHRLFFAYFDEYSRLYHESESQDYYCGKMEDL
jgi:hypothetical protein